MANVSEDAVEYLDRLRKLHVAAGSPQGKKWYFDPGTSSAIHAELETLGYVSRLLGTERGYAWQLTELAIGSRTTQARQVTQAAARSRADQP